MDLKLVPNDDEIKLTWRAGEGSWLGPIRIDMKRLISRARHVRDDLDSLTRYMRENPSLLEDNDANWANYSKILTQLQRHGQSLCHAIFPLNDLKATSLLNELCDLPRETILNIHCSGNEVTVPFGFVYRSVQPVSQVKQLKKPSLEDFADFWVCRFDITMSISRNNNKKALRIAPDSFRSLYALHREEMLAAHALLGEYGKKLQLLTQIEFKDRYDWNSAEHVCNERGGWNGVVFVVAHSDGDYLDLGDSEIDSELFADIIYRNNHVGLHKLIVLNCCNAVAGDDNCSLLQAISERGLGGLVGTEAEILNVHAIRCGTQLLWGLCAEGLPLGKAFRNMQEDNALFPHNLLYTCYADREFGLESPLTELIGKTEGFDPSEAAYD